jgi:hypothetical protein
MMPYGSAVPRDVIRASIYAWDGSLFPDQPGGRQGAASHAVYLNRLYAETPRDRRRFDGTT